MKENENKALWKASNFCLNVAAIVAGSECLPCPWSFKFPCRLTWLSQWTHNRSTTSFFFFFRLQRHTSFSRVLDKRRNVNFLHWMFLLLVSADFFEFRSAPLMDRSAAFLRRFLLLQSTCALIGMKTLCLLSFPMVPVRTRLCERMHLHIVKLRDLIDSHRCCDSNLWAGSS